MAILKRGLAGEPVKLLQKKLGVEADGRFGPGTETALQDYQKKNGLQVDGIAGPDTFVHMGLFELVLLRTGSRGEAVKKLQQAVGVTADGVFGAGTEKAVRAFQEKNGLEADGMAGPATLAKTNAFKEMTADVVKRSELGAGAGASAGGGAAGEASAEPAPSRSIWGSIKSFFGA
ncbi:peptidoglycan-binding domain-containing protein [Rhodoplanes roseus]|uniref:Peptidoglycan-binding protein n=1 Tax=Rhodoplanes roseus TaxID=29409 RepID=A0A327KUX3_9BRAD|nr:peptidoglycan-binding protein [Rhodoplanes roseus]RAI41876.1 peptidoglycan-binding protein [Rhodoplanes roseus]